MNMRKRKSVPKKHRQRRSLLGFEPLEVRQLLASDLVALAPDFLTTIQDQTGQVLDLLSNDRFDPAYAGERKITSVSVGNRGGELSIAADGLSVRYTPPPGSSDRRRPKRR